MPTAISRDLPLVAMAAAAAAGAAAAGAAGRLVCVPALVPPQPQELAPAVHAGVAAAAAAASAAVLCAVLCLQAGRREVRSSGGH